jgi:hypothetical protein
MYATPFILDRDISNKYKYSKDISNTLPKQLNGCHTSIPFLRSSSVEYKSIVSRARNKAYRNNNSFANTGKRTLSTVRKRIKELRKENGWDQYVKPISAFNEKVHSSQKVVFEKI